MAKPKLFIGSSEASLPVARLFKQGLKACAQVTVWDEDVFDLSRGYLEVLTNQVQEYDFALFVLAPDDITSSKGETMASPRDNVLFESGLFMGALGRERVFLVNDKAVPTKILSDFAGITLAGYDGSQIAQYGKAAVREACQKVNKAITAARFANLVGDWRSVYPMTFKDGCPMADEVLEIRPGPKGLSFVTKHGPLEDHYSCYGCMTVKGQITGKWMSPDHQNNQEGVFMLTVDPNATMMYGYFTSPDEKGGVVYATWLLAKMIGADDATIQKRLASAQKLLRSTVKGDHSALR